MTSLLDPKWIAEQEAKDRKANGGFKKPNPCVRTYGPGPEGRKCEECRLLRVHASGRRYYKCLLRGISWSASTDHLVRWPACAKFVDTKRTEPMTHRLKIVSPYYEQQMEGVKQWELRQEDDKFFVVGDTLELEHWERGAKVEGDLLLTRTVVAITRGPCYGLLEGWVILSTRSARREMKA